MNNLCRLLSIVMFLITTMTISFAQNITTDRQIPIYQTGETVNFNVTGIWGTSKYKLLYDKKSPTYSEALPVFEQLAVAEGTVSNGQNISYTLTEPGVILLMLEQGAYPNNTAAAVCNPMEIKPLTEDNFGFDDFWNNIKNQQPTLNISSINQLPLVSDNGTVKTYMIQLPLMNGKTVSGYVTTPKNIDTTLPLILDFQSFSLSATSDDYIRNLLASSTPAIVLSINAHTNDNSPTSTTIATNDTDPNTYNYRYSIAAGFQAIRFIESQTNIFNGTIGVTGESQGGGISLILAGLDARVKGIFISNPAMCEHKGTLLNRASGFPDYVMHSQSANKAAVADAARYFDAAIAAKRTSASLFVTNGYLDLITPANSVFAAASQTRGQFHIVHGVKKGHEHNFGGYYENSPFIYFKKVLYNQNYTNTGASVVYFADAGMDATTKIGTPITLNGSIMKNAATINVPIRWEVVTQPSADATPSFQNPNSLITQVTFSKIGTYTLRLISNPIIDDSNPQVFHTTGDYINVVVENDGIIVPPPPPPPPVTVIDTTVQTICGITVQKSLNLSNIGHTTSIVIRNDNGLQAWMAAIDAGSKTWLSFDANAQVPSIAPTTNNFTLYYTPNSGCAREGIIWIASAVCPNQAIQLKVSQDKGVSCGVIVVPPPPPPPPPVIDPNMHTKCGISILKSINSPNNGSLISTTIKNTNTNPVWMASVDENSRSWISFAANSQNNFIAPGNNNLVFYTKPNTGCAREGIIWVASANCPSEGIQLKVNQAAGASCGVIINPPPSLVVTTDKADIQVSVIPSKTNITPYENITFSIFVQNKGAITADNIIVDLNGLKTDTDANKQSVFLKINYPKPAKGVINYWVGTWNNFSLKPGEVTRLDITVRMRWLNYCVPTINISAIANTSSVESSKANNVGNARLTCSSISRNDLLDNSLEFAVYPNPAMDNFTINLNNALNETLNLTISTLEGKVVQRELITSNIGIQNIDIQQLTAGMYIIQVVNDAQKILKSEKLIKIN